MTVYLINIALTLVLGICLIYIQPTQQKKKIFCWLSSTSWVLISGLRHISIGADTANYARSFERAGSTEWVDVFNAMYRVYLQGYSPELSAEYFLYKDPGYLLFQKVVHLFTDNYQVYLVLIAAFFFAAMGRFIYKNSVDPCFSYILFSTLFYSFFAITGHRQTLATTLIVFIGYEFIKERKFWKFILVALLAYLLHKSSIVFLPFYFLSRIKISGKYLAALGGFTAVILGIGGQATIWLASLVGYDIEEVYEAATYTFTTLMVMVALVVLLCYSRFKNDSPYKGIEVSATMLAAMFALFTLVNHGMMRIQQYYSLAMMLSLPSAFTAFKPRNRFLVTLLCVFVLVILLIRNSPQYRFFWQ